VKRPFGRELQDESSQLGGRERQLRRFDVPPAVHERMRRRSARSTLPARRTAARRALSVELVGRGLRQVAHAARGQGERITDDVALLIADRRDVQGAAQGLAADDVGAVGVTMSALANRTRCNPSDLVGSRCEPLRRGRLTRSPSAGQQGVLPHPGEDFHSRSHPADISCKHACQNRRPTASRQWSSLMPSTALGCRSRLAAGLA
jgi:hypothetical protein